MVHFFYFMMIVPIISLVGCASVSSSFVPEVPVVSQQKASLEEVEFLTRPPSRVALRIGVISTGGNGFADFDDLIKEAKKKAAKIGGDFILVQNSGIESDTYYSPGYTTYQSNAHASYGSRSGYGESAATGYSVGPSSNTVHRPWGVFSVWVYKPSQLGVQLDKGYIITGFHLNSDAKKAGLKIGDKLVGIDGRDINDQKTIEHSMTIQSGDKVKLSVDRDSQRIEVQITALPN